MSDEPKRTRKPNPFTTYKKAKAAADRARRAAVRADKLREQAQAAAEKAAELKLAVAALEAEELVAYEALQEAIEATDASTDDDDEEGDE